MRQENIHEVYNESDNEDENDEEKRTLFCANVDERVTEDLLYELFLQAGPIESARIPKENSGKQRTFGFVTYVHKCSVGYAMQLFQGISLFRKTLIIKNQGNTQPSPIRNYNSPGYNNKRSSYDNSSLRGPNYSYNDMLPQNPFRNNSPDFPSSSGKHQDNISKHSSPHRRPHKNASPYQRNSTGSDDRYRVREGERDHRRRRYNNGNNRHSDGGGRHRR